MQYITVRSRFSRRRAYATWTIIAINVLWFLLVEGSFGLTPDGLVHAGAADSTDVFGGQWFRLFSAMFVHMGWAHIGFNMVALASLYVIEILIGTAAFVTTYVIAGVAGSLLTVILNPDGLLGGASGAIFGIFGVALTLAFQGVLTKASRNQLILVLVVNLVYGFSVPGVGVTAHLTGFVVGVLATFVMKSTRSHGVMWRVLAWACSVVTVLSLGLALRV